MFGRRRVAALEERVAQMEASLSVAPAVAADLPGIGLAVEGHTAWLTAIEAGLTGVREAHESQLRDLGRWLAATTHTVSSMSSTPVLPSPELQAIGPQARLVDERMVLARTLKVWTVMRWLAQAPVESDTLISVIIPTRDRRAYLERAMGSVLQQRHRAFELIVVDDGSVDETADFLRSVTDPRVKVLRTTGVGASAARNFGVDAVTGTIVTHLDDDNLMDPGWLRAVAWAFERWPDSELLYGARIIEDGPARDRAPSGAMPSIEWVAFDRTRLEQSNYIDMNVIAHRVGLKEARFDDQLLSSIEWEMLLRLTATRAPLELPAIACLYSNYAPNRLSDRKTYLDENRIVRSRVHTTRPMRVLCYNALFPLVSETYIEEEMLALEAQGASIAFAAFARSVSPYEISQPIYSGLDEGIAAHDPDVVMVYWTSHATGELEHLHRAGRPFALRVHSFDFDVGAVMQITAHPGCVGVWTYPHQADSIPGAHVLVPIFSTHTAMPEPLAERSVVASVSAGLPKKNWPLLLETMDRLSDLERVVVLARSNGFENVPDDVARLAACQKRPPTVSVNMPRQDVFRLLARTSVLLYTVASDLPLGMPMSVIEGLRAGACVVTPDRPEMQALCGMGFRPYRTADDIVSHVREIIANGPGIAEERTHNRDYALDRFCAPELGRRFHAELSGAVTAWRGRQQVG